jgi:hypothetical protein
MRTRNHHITTRIDWPGRTQANHPAPFEGEGGGGGGAPDPHAPTHAVGGSDPVPVTTLGGYPGGTTTFLRADGTFALPPAGGGGSGDVVGPASATDDAIALWDGTTGKLLQDSAVLLSGLAVRPVPIADGGTGVTSGLTALNASNLTSGTLPDARFPAMLPAVSGQNLTNLPAAALTGTVAVAQGGTGVTTGLTQLNATNLTSGTVPDARFPAVLPAVSGANLTNLNASSLTSGTVPLARLPAHHATHETGGADAIVTLSAAVLTSGTVADARLSSNVALKNIDNAFVPQTFASTSVIAGANSLFYFRDTSAPLDQKVWRVVAYSAGHLYFECLKDDLSVVQFQSLALYRTGGVGVGPLTVGGTIQLTGGNKWIYTNVDTSLVTIVGGSNALPANGAYLSVAGTANASAPGCISAALGNHASAYFRLYSGAGTEYFSVRGSDGHASFTTASGASAYFNSTSSTGGYITFLVSGAIKAYVGSSAVLYGGTINDFAIRVENSGTLYLNAAQATFTGNATVNGNGTVIGVSQVSTYLHLTNAGGNTIYMNVSGQIVCNTSSGADSGYIRISGASGVDTARAAYFEVCGNQSGYSGSVNAWLSSHASAHFRVGNYNATRLWFYVRGTDGLFSFDTSVAIMGYFNSTAANGGWIQFNTSGAATGYIGTAATLISTSYINSCLCVRSANKLLLKSDVSEILAPDMYNNTVGVGANMNIDNTGLLRRFSSTRRHKTGIVPLDDWRDLLRLTPVSYTHRGEPAARRVGFVAEDVAAVDRRLVTCDADGQPDGVTYAQLTAPLVLAIQDLHARLAALEAKGA